MPQPSNCLSFLKCQPGKMLKNVFSVNIYLFKVNNTTTRKRCQIPSKLIVKTPNDVYHVVLIFLLLTWTYFTPFSSASIVDFEQVNVSRVISFHKKKRSHFSQSQTFAISDGRSVIFSTFF